MRRDPNLTICIRCPRSALVAAVLCMTFVVMILSRNVCASDLPNSSHANTPHLRNFEPPFPFNASDLWQQLAEVTALHGVDITREKIENIFGTRLYKVISHIGQRDDITFQLEAPKEWYYNIIFMNNKHFHYFAFSWNGYGGLPLAKGDICISPKTVNETLSRQGWRSAFHELAGGFPIGEHFQYDQSSLAAYFDPNSSCLLSIAVIRL